MRCGKFPPCEFILEELEARGQTASTLINSPIMCHDEELVRGVLNGRRRITPELAILLGQFFDMSPQFFTNMQRSYENDS